MIIISCMIKCLFLSFLTGMHLYEYTYTVAVKEKLYLSCFENILQSSSKTKIYELVVFLSNEDSWILSIQKRVRFILLSYLTYDTK